MAVKGAKKKMTQAGKKRVDFNTLDFTKVSSDVAKAIVPAPIEGLEPEKPAPVLEGCWINSKPIEEVSSIEFKAWLSNLLPGAGFEKFNDAEITSAKDK